MIAQVKNFDVTGQASYFRVRDAGMAALATYLVEQAPRAALWAHDGHVARHDLRGGPVLGAHLATVSSHRYYPVGFYLYEGSVRAWDPRGKVGVISYPFPRASDYMVEGAVMAATGTPEIAWLPVRSFSPALQAWAARPRYVRELGAVYEGDESSLRLCSVPTEYDALVVIRTGHDSSPTPTGVRKAGD